MRKTIPSYTIFTCDCCGREQDDLKRQKHLAQYGEDLGPDPIYGVQWNHRYADTQQSMELCEECSTRIHDAIKDVIRKASSEAIHESLAIIERTHS